VSKVCRRIGRCAICLSAVALEVDCDEGLIVQGQSDVDFLDGIIYPRFPLIGFVFRLADDDLLDR